MQLSTSVSQLSRVGSVLEKRLKHLGIYTVHDLLWYFPFRYEDFRNIASIGSLKDGWEGTIQGTLSLIANRKSPRKRTLLTEAIIEDSTGQLRVVWFGQPFLAKSLAVGDRVSLSGKVKSDRYGMQMVSPSYEKIVPEGATPIDDAHVTTHTARIVPLYSLTTGMTQKQMRFLMPDVSHRRMDS